MIVYANVFSDNDEATFGMATVSGAHFYQDNDPTGTRNKVLKVSTWNTNLSDLFSTTNVIGNVVSNAVSCCEFEMKYFFDVIPWLYWPRYFILEFLNNSNTKLFSLRFEAVEHKKDGGPASKIAIKQERGTVIDGTTISAGMWHRLRIEYYPNAKDPENSRAKIYIASGDGDFRIAADIAVQGYAGVITKATIRHSATKIRGTQYFDDLSFTLTDRKYSPLPEAPTPIEKKKIYDFENGIPSDRSFNINMQLKKGDERADFDPATWKSAAIGTSFSHSRNFYEILLVLSGNGAFVTDSREYPMGEGSIFIIAPGRNRTIMSTEGYKILSVTGHFERLAFIEDSCAMQDNIYNEGRKLAELILYNRFGNEDYTEALCDAYIKYLLINLDRQPKNTTASIYKIISKMEKHFQNSDLSIGKLLAESGYAKDYIRAEFLAVTKVTPKKYLNNIRMKNAKAMLDLYGNDMSISEIAERCGIIDSSIFSRIFKKHFGISPTHYKDSLK